MELRSETLNKNIEAFLFMKTKNRLHRKSVYEKFNFTCQKCKLYFKVPKNWNGLDCIKDHNMFLEIDHIIPLSKGGSDKIENKQPLCWKCNNIKSNKI